MKPIIEITNLGKKYPILHEKARYGTLRDSLVNFLKNPFAPRMKRESFWALNDINLNIERGDIVGVIGRNGAGKSTLLKIISGITKPTTGKIKLYGRVSSLLEVGTGFHPELTGRENIFLNGVILGMTRREVAKKFDEIVAFANIEKFLDTQVKHYSSGMYVRLAFAVAAHLEPDILIVDEVLAVGDAEFQKKCLGKMSEVSKKEGRTVIFVSHNMVAIGNLCSKVILLESGRVTKIGKVDETVSFYLDSVKQNVSTEKIWTDNRPGDEYIRFNSIRLLDEDNKPLTKAWAEHPVIVEIRYEILTPVRNLQLGFYLKNEMHVIFESADMKLPEDSRIIREKGVHTSLCTIPSDFLNASIYSLTLFSHIPFQAVNVKIDDILVIDVDKKNMWSGNDHQPGLLRPKLLWKIIR